MKLLHHPATTALGASTIALLPMLGPIVSPEHGALYHLMGRVSALIIPILLNFALCWLVLTLLFACAAWNPRIQIWLPAVILLTGGWLLKTWYIRQPQALVRPANMALILLSVAVLTAQPLLYLRAPARLRQMWTFTSTLLGFAALSGVLLLIEIGVCGFQARHLNASAALHRHLDSASRPHPSGLIVWIVFDELSFRQVYEHPAGGLNLPAFNRLAQSATVFTHALPVALYTEHALPSLLVGRRFDRLRTSAAAWPIQLRDPSTHGWETLNPQDTVFGDALAAGYRTAIAGWYNPYCRMLPGVLDRCFWTLRERLHLGMYTGQGILWNTKQPALYLLSALATRLHLPPLSSTPGEVFFHQQDFRDLAAAADASLAEPRGTFLLIHMPIPHPPGIYNRHAASFDTHQPSYLDNLALCDLYLDHVRQVLERNGTWDDTLLLVMGDHSWRVHLGYAGTPGWTPEERIASDNAHFDDRPAYIVKLPHQRSSLRIETPFDAIRTRQLIDSMIAGRIETPAQLASWAAPYPAR